MSLIEEHGMPNIHFVIPQDCTSSEQCSGCIKQAFESCESHLLRPKWITEEQCLEMEPVKKDVFVLEKFEGSAFDYLQKFKCVVAGARCILVCLATCAPIPKVAQSIFSVAMSGLIVTLTGFEDEKKKFISKKIQYMAGTYVPKLLKTVTHLVVNSVLSTKFEKALALGVTCVTEEWVTSVWEASQTRDVHGSDEEFLVHKCKIFHNLNISLTNFRGTEKENLKQAILANGGIFNGDFIPDQTDLLIVAKTGGPKYAAARGLNLPCLSSSWVYQSVKEGRPIGIEGYEFEHRDCSTPNGDKRYLPDISCVSAIHPQEPFNTGPVNETRLNDTTASTATNQSMMSCKGPSQNVDVIESLDLKEAEKAGAFLDGCSIYLSGFSLTTSDKLRRILKYGQATKLNEISDSVSHVVVGNVVVEDFQALKTCVTRPHIVKADWIVESIKRGSPAPEEPFLCWEFRPRAAEPASPSLKKGLQMLKPQADRTLPQPRDCHAAMSRTELSESTAGAARKVEPPPENLIPQYLNKDETFLDLGGGNLFKDSDKMRSQDVETPSQAQSTLASMSSTAIPAFFEDLTFLLVGFNGDSLEQLEELVTMNGGTVVGSKFLGIPDYAVVPFDGAVLHHACGEIVSHLWVEDCCDQGGIVPLQYYHRPVTIPEKVKPLTGCVIGITSYVGRERDFISKLSDILGALAQDVLSKKDCAIKNAKASTHLICREPGSQKYNAAIKWKLPAVTHEWLLACMQERKKAMLRPYLIGESTVPEDELNYPTPKPLRQKSAAPSVKESFESPATGAKEPCEKGAARKQGSSELEPAFTYSSRETITPVSSRSELRSKPDIANNVSEGKKMLGSKNTTPAGVTSRVSAIEPIDPVTVPAVDTPVNTSHHYGFSQETPLNISRIRPATSGTPCLRRAALTPKVDQGVSQGTPLTPRPPGHIDTPETPYGLRSDPSPETRKNWKRWINKFPDLRKNEPLPEKTRRDSTPLAELYRKCWAKFGANHPEDTDENSQHSASETERVQRVGEGRIEDAPAVSARKRLSIHDSPEFTQPLPVTSQISGTTGINTQLANLNELLASPRMQTPSSMKRTSSALDSGDCKRTEDSLEKPGKISRESSVKEVAWTYDASQAETTTTYKFMLSTLEVEERAKYIAIINRLGGSVAHDSNFDPSATHLISTKLARSEKLLASIASGKWVLHKEYLDISNQHGCFSEEELFEWGNPATLHPITPKSSLDTDLAKACHYWRKKVAESGNVGAFKGFKAILATDPSKEGPLKRLIQAGGGAVTNSRPPFSDPDGATHCFVEFGKISFKVDLPSLVDHGVWCVPPIYLSNYLMQTPPPDPAAFQIPEAKQYLATKQKQ